MVGPDDNWLSKRARQNQAGLIAVVSPVASQKFDGLTGSWSRAIVTRMRTAGESMRGIASITEQHLVCMMNAPVIGSPVMDELSRQAKEQSLDRRALLSYSSYDSDDDSDRSVQRKNTRADQKVRDQMLPIVSLL
jgi:hypothetical protein